MSIRTPLSFVPLSRLKIFLSSCLLVLATAALCAAASHPQAYGVWLALNHRQDIGGDLADLSHYKGMQNIYTWAEIEPSEGVFAWKLLDEKLEKAVDLGLFYSIGIAVGPLSPLWIYDHGVPRVTTVGHPRTGPYPYYLDPHYRFYVDRMIAEFGKHIRSLPARLLDHLVFVSVMTGSTQDESPYKGRPLDHAISADDWLKFRESLYAQYNDAFQKGPGTPIPLLFNGLMSWSSKGPQARQWVEANIKEGWGHKASVGCFYQLNGEGSRIKEYLPPIIAPQPGANDFSFTRSEMDSTWQYPIFQTNVAMNLYWTALGALNSGLCIWHLTTDVREWCHDHNYWEFADFFNRYAGQVHAPTATGAFCALREGLDASDTAQFPEPLYGKADSDNKDRYLAICQAYAPRGAKLDSPAALVHGESKQRTTQKGFNDVGWDICEGNYQRFLRQVDPDETSIGLWRRVGGEITGASAVYGRFARGFDHAAKKDEMDFALDPAFFGGKPLKGKYPITVRIVYYDQGVGKWALEYDAVGDPSKTACIVTKTNTGSWKEKIVTLSDAYFGRRGPRGSDVRLVNRDSEDDIFHLVEVTRNPKLL